MNYFSGCADLKQARKEYIKLAQKHHPDKGGDQAIMKEINNQFDRFKKSKSKVGFDTYSYRGREYHQADAFSYSFNWGNIYEYLKSQGFSSKYKSADGWSEEYEAEANKKEKERKEKLAADMAEAQRKKTAKRARIEKLLKDDMHRIWFEINRDISQNFANGLIDKMPDHSLCSFIKEATIMRIIKG